MDRDPGQPGELLDQLRRQRRRAGEHQPHRAQPLPQAVDVAPVGEHRRRDRDDAAGLVLDQVERALGVEPSGEHELGPVVQRDPEDGVEAVDVEHRQHGEHHVVAVDHRRVDRGDLVDVGEQRAVREHRRARAPRRTAGVEQRRQLLRVLERRDGVGPLGAEVVVGALVRLQGRADHHDPGPHQPREQVGLDRARSGGRPPSPRRGPPDRPAHLADRVGVGQHEPRAGVRDHPGQLSSGGRRVHRDGDGLGAQDAEVRRHELEPVAHHDHHPVAGDDPRGAETGREPADLVLELGPRGAAAPGLDDGQLVGVLGGGADQQVCDVRGPRRRCGLVVGAAMDGYFHNGEPRALASGLVPPPERTAPAGPPAAVRARR